MSGRWTLCASLSSGTSVEEGSEMACCMLDVDLADSHIVVSLNPKLVEAISGGAGHERKKGKSSRKTKQDLVSPP